MKPEQREIREARHQVIAALGSDGLDVLRDWHDLRMRRDECEAEREGVWCCVEELLRWAEK